MRKNFSYYILILAILVSVNYLNAQENEKGKEVAPRDATLVKPPFVVKIPSQAQSSITVEAKGPGALYIARLNDGIGVWVINEGKITPAGTVKFAEGKRIPNRFVVVMSNKIRAILYEDNLPVEMLSQMSFSGNLENKDCPLCTVSMPLALQTPVERRDKRYYEQILSFEERLKSAEHYEKLGNQMENLIQKQIVIIRR